MRLVTIWWAAFMAGACSAGFPQANPNTALTPATHGYFPITSVPHAVDCNTCHGGYSSFKEFSCLSCHGHDDQTLTNQLHQAVPTYAYQSSACYTCHATGAHQPFDHAGITGNCASCHDVGAIFAALPVSGFTHQPITQDCKSCHKTDTWLGASGAPLDLRSDPKATVTVNALIPTYSGDAIATLTPKSEALPMPMNHGSAAIPAAANGACTSCHANVTGGSYYPGNFHQSLAALGLAEPTACLDCHQTSAPTGFVGPTAARPARTPSSGEMKHDAVTWSNGAPEAAALVTADCGVCHTSPSQQAAAWTTDHSGAAPAVYHPALTGAGLPQPGSCVDCHANSQPAAQGTSQARITDSTVLTSASNDPSTGVASGTHDQINHADLNVTSHDCNFCHIQSGFSTEPNLAGKEWTLAKFHQSFSASDPLVLDGASGRCSNCHMNVRPGPSFSKDHSGFTDAPGSQDCNQCHSWPGTGTPSGPNWLGATNGAPACINTGGFDVSDPPAASTTTVQPGVDAGSSPSCLPHPSVATTECSTCHTGGIGGKRAIGYDHASNLIDHQCRACHESGSDLVGTAWNGAKSTPGAGDTRPYTLNGDQAPNHFYPTDCYECHNASVGNTTTVTNGQTYQDAWNFPHDTSRMNQTTAACAAGTATCILCHGSCNGG